MALYLGSPSATMVRASPPMLMVKGSALRRVTETTPGTFKRLGTCSVS
jgi:hypothetical protein